MVTLQRFIDRYIGAIIILFLLPFKLIDNPNKKKKKILLIKLWALGDAVISLSLIRACKEKFKGCSVDVLTRDRVQPVFESYNKVDDIINLDSSEGILKLIRKIRYYDIVFDTEPYFNISAILGFLLGKRRVGFSRSWRSGLYTGTVDFRKDQHMVQNYIDMIRLFGVNYDTDKLEKLETKNKKDVDKYLEGKKRPLIGITPGVGETVKSRMWYEDRFAELADRLIRELGATVILIDSAGNRKTVNSILRQMQQKPLTAVGKFNLKEVFYLIERCDVFISNDTGPMHIAAAQGCKTIGLFGPNTPMLWGPYGKENIAIYKTKLEPSIHNDKGIFIDKDREGYMGPIKVKDVFGAAKRLIKK